MLGGLAERAGALDNLREKHPDLVALDTGDIFGIDDELPKARAVLDCYALLGYEALALGDQDLRVGELTVSGLLAANPFICANIEPEAEGAPAIPGSLVIERRGVRLGLVAVINEDILGLPELLADQGYRVTPWREALDAELDELEAEDCGIIVLLSHLGVTEEVYAARDYTERLDLIVGGHAGLFRYQPDTEEGVPIIWSGRLGRYLGVATLSLDPERLGEIVSYEALPVDRSHGRGADVLARLREYEEVRYLDWLDEYYVATAEPLFFAPEDCGACHANEYERWLSTDHANAFATLADEGDERNLECVRCHSTGFARPGGFADAERTPGLTDVGCQMCHQTQPGHPFESTQVPAVGVELCAKCHKPDRDDDFQYSRDIEYVEH